MDVVPVTVHQYQTASGRCPFREWRLSLDSEVRRALDSRLIRVRRGLFGDVKPLGGGLWELRFDVGPGYRVYFARNTATLVVLLIGGEKRGQRRDIAAARAALADYLRRHEGC